MKKTPSGIRCPTCGHPGMKHVVRSVVTKVGRRRISVPGIRVEECSRCGEILYDLAALAAIRRARRGSAACSTIA